jgi:hypothetical protein
VGQKESRITLKSKRKYPRIPLWGGKEYTVSQYSVSQNTRPKGDAVDENSGDGIVPSPLNSIYLRSSTFTIRYSCFRMANTADILLSLESGNHHVMPAAKTTKLEISSGMKDEPSVFSAGMSFFHS